MTKHTSLKFVLAAALALVGCGPELTSTSIEDAAIDSTTAELNSAIYNRAQAYAAAHPRRDGSSWNQWCGSLMWRFGNLPGSAARPSAISAYRASSIVSTNPATALVGAFHWWDIGADGHVGMDLNGGGRQVFMATYNLAASWGDAIGINSVSGYTNKTGARYLGWSMDYAGGRISGGGGQPVNGGGGAGPASAGCSLNLPDAQTQARVQAGLKLKGRYSGPVDGALGLNGFKGIQTTLRNVGYAGPIDGVIGSEGCRLIQVYAAKYGDYTGPIDRILGPNSWRGLALGLERP